MRLVVYICGLLLLGLFLIISCVNTRTNASIENHKVSKITEGRLVGTYRGNLPCTDCDAIATALTLANDKAYTLEYIYVGKSAEPFSKTGTWELKDGELNLEGLDYKYKVEPDQLRQLDLSGKEIRGELAERYLLHYAN
ncbi:copper resistance protein NlpE N-terminal domain-containing protein [Sphingobacterium sp. DN00404]|uniref:Copper resistance protein NlpE N-terminal domain-containing protein n=1 Tax=Sphingobacterium micropteri TaxID=2763501 RepID=A0ABR7YNF7_9SPHI|nr:copper resistance protein NlpE [Sphingobacterium micropteri]MBD1432847.1 copper resistance protein NlpE N-terminal domain-containing protein [Sphingobacterium micropteri]